MKKLIFILLVCSAISVLAQKANFSGTWLLNKTKTNFGTAPEWVLPKTVKVDQQADKLTITRINLDQQLKEQAPIAEILTFDGKPLQRTLDNGATVTTTVHWQNDQSFNLSRRSTQIIEEAWTLQDNGKTLVIDHSVEQANGVKFTIKCYYDKTNPN